MKSSRTPKPSSPLESTNQVEAHALGYRRFPETLEDERVALSGVQDVLAENPWDAEGPSDPTQVSAKRTGDAETPGSGESRWARVAREIVPVSKEVGELLEALYWEKRKPRR